MTSKRYPCPCCKYLTLIADIGSFDICSVCGWQDDFVQFKDPDYEGGANPQSLNQARENYRKFGAKNLDALEYVRPPLPDEIP